MGFLGAVGMAGNMAGSIVDIINAGKKPDLGPSISQVQPIDTWGTYWDALRNMRDAYGYMTPMTQAINLERMGQRGAQIQQVMPQARSVRDAATSSLMSDLAETLTPAERELIKERAAAKGLSLGVPGSDMQDAWALGSQLEVMRKGRQAATYAAPSFISGMVAPYLTPVTSSEQFIPSYANVLQTIGLGSQQRGQLADWLAQRSVIEAAPDPQLTALSQAFHNMGGMGMGAGLSGIFGGGGRGVGADVGLPTSNLYNPYSYGQGPQYPAY